MPQEKQPVLIHQKQITASVLDEQALVALDRAAHTKPFDTEILQSAPAQDIRVQIGKIITLLKAVDAGKMLRRQGVISRLTGADVEARLEFELAAQQVMSAMELLRRAEATGSRIRILLGNGRKELHREQKRLGEVIAASKQLLAAAVDADPFLRSRFERRLANIMTMHAANITTIEQIGLAEQVLKSLLDRVTDVHTALFPMWQRSVIALVHASPGQSQQSASVAFVAVHDKFIAYLVQEST